MQYKHDLEVTVLLTTAANHVNPLEELHCIMHHFVLCDVDRCDVSYRFMNRLFVIFVYN